MFGKKSTKNQTPAVQPEAAAAPPRRYTREELLAKIHNVTPPVPEEEKTLTFSDLREMFGDKLGKPGRGDRDIREIKRYWRRR